MRTPESLRQHISAAWNQPATWDIVALSPVADGTDMSRITSTRAVIVYMIYMI